MMKCHENIKDNERSNFSDNEVMLDESLSHEQIIRQLFVNVVEKLERGHDFEKEIKYKKEIEKLKIIREIKERLSFLNENELIPKISEHNLGSLHGGPPSLMHNQ